VLDDAQALGSIVAGWPGQGESLQPVDHALTHFDWRLHPVRWALPGRLAATRLAAVEARLRSTGDGRWVDVAEAADLGMPAPLRRLIAPGSRGPAVVRP
jgi:A/G-specific adenine glycosylase